MMSQTQNPYEPYPKWFERYGPKLSKFPHGEYLKNQILENIKWFRENVLTKEKRVCQNCQRDYIALKSSKNNCPFCKAPRDYNVSRIENWLSK